MPISRRKTVQIEEEEEQQVDWAPKIDEPTSIGSLRVMLDRVKSRDGIIGYIVRGPTSASIDIKDPSKIIDYAALSAEAMDSGENLSQAFELGKISSIVLEGRNVKILLLKKGEHELTVFMDKNMDHISILKELS